MTCKDCLHYEACKDIHDILDPACSGEFDYERLERGCKNFTDPSEWVHLEKIRDRKEEGKCNIKTMKKQKN